ETYRGITILAPVDAVAMTLLYRIGVSSRRCEHELRRLQQLASEASVQSGGYVASILERALGRSWAHILQDLQAARSWEDLATRYKATILAAATRTAPRPLERPRKLLRSLGHKLGVPRYRIRGGGKLVAFVGVDGSGKSSNVEFVQNLTFFELTGVRRTYFGNNEYWIPGLAEGGIRFKDHRLASTLFSVLRRIDRQARLGFAMYYMSLGNLVLADRYYYDDLYGEQRHRELGRTPEKRGHLRRLFGEATKVRMLRTPDLTLFMNVSPEVAYTRKQDFSYEVMLEANSGYRRLMAGRDETVSIDSDQSQEDVRKDVLRALVELEDNVRASTD
ncbi:MAG: thymidylate kinase, partial [Myxococcota bacterium]